MGKVRVLVANRPRLMREVVQATLSGQPDIEVVGEIQGEPEILPALEQTHANYLIIDLEEPGCRPSICDFVMAKYPDTKILAVAAGKGDSAFYWVSTEIRSTQIETSEEGVLKALRSKPGS